jgi:hypothetical protein
LVGFQKRVGDELTLYVRQLAWLYSVPQLPPKVREAAEKSGQKIQPNSVSRYDEMTASNISPPMPPNPMPHFILWFTEIGMVEAGGMGSAPLSWREIVAWQDNVRIRLTPWQARMMRSLSVAYLAQKAKSELTTDPAPWSAGVTDSARAADEAAIDAMFG